MQLSSFASSALELQLLPLVLRNLITTTPNSTYMYIMIRHSHSATIFEVYLLVSITDINSNHDSMTKVWQHCVVLPFKKKCEWRFNFHEMIFSGKKLRLKDSIFVKCLQAEGIMEKERKKWNLIDIYSVGIQIQFKM